MLTFGSPLLLIGAAGISIPILIHLLNRMRYRTVDWAAMKFLLQAQEEERRRVQLEQWLLLALRCLLVLLLVLAIADPALRHAGLGAALGGTSTERIVVLDDTYSMGHTPAGDRSGFDLARVEIERLVETLSRERPRDTLSLVLASRPSEPIVQGMALSAENQNRFRETLRGLRVSDRARPVRQTLEKFHATLGDEGESGPREIYFFSDFRRSDWAPRQWRAGFTQPTAVPGLSHSLSWTLIDVGHHNAENLSLIEVVTAPRRAVRGLPLRITAQVQNRGPRPASDVRVRVEVGDTIERESTIDRIESGKTTPVHFEVSIPESGEYPLKVEIDPDALGADDILYSKVEVIDNHTILLVDSDQASRGAWRETYPLARAIDPPGPVRSGYATQSINALQFRDVKNLDDYAILFFCNVPPFSSTRIEEIEAYVRRGGSAVFFLGEQVDPGDYNRAFYRDGKGLLPYPLAANAELTVSAGGPSRYAHLDPAAAQHPLMRHFRSESGAGLLRNISFYRAFRLAEPETPIAGSSIVCRYSDIDSSAAIAEKVLGQGRTILLTTTADRGLSPASSIEDLGWNDWSAHPTFLAFIQDLCHSLLSLRPPPKMLRPGDRIRFPLDTHRFEKEVQITPHAEQEGTVAYAEPARPDREEGDRGLWVEFDRTGERGLTLFELQPLDGSDPHRRYVPITLDPRDGNLEKAPPALVHQVLREAAHLEGIEPEPVEFYEIWREEGARNWLAYLEEKNRIWQWIAAALLFFTLFESTYAWWIGRP